MYRTLILSAALLALAGCSSLNANPVPPQVVNQIKHVCIRSELKPFMPQASASEYFVKDMINALHIHGISTSNSASAQCSYYLDYAFNNHDELIIGVNALVQLVHNGKVIASVDYRNNEMVSLNPFSSGEPDTLWDGYTVINRLLGKDMPLR